MDDKIKTSLMEMNDDQLINYIENNFPFAYKDQIEHICNYILCHKIFHKEVTIQYLLNFIVNNQIKIDYRSIQEYITNNSLFNSKIVNNLIQILVKYNEPNDLSYDYIQLFLKDKSTQNIKLINNLFIKLGLFK